MYHQISNSTGRNYNARIYRNVPFSPHFHRSYELIHVLSGEMEVKVNGTAYRLGAGQTLFVPPHAVHALSCNMDSRCWVGVFSRDRVGSGFPEMLGGRCSPFCCEPEVRAFLEQKLFIRNTPSELELSACLCLAADQCLKYAAPSAQTGDRTARERIVRYMEEHFRQNVTLRDMASDLGYEYHYLSRLFHNCFSMNFKEYLNGFRFEHAYELLQKTDLTTQRIAMESGFGSTRNLDRVFRKMSGKAPKDCRNL